MRTIAKCQLPRLIGLEPGVTTQQAHRGGVPERPVVALTEAIQLQGSTFRRCGCRDEAGRQLGKACPKLASRRHGSWFYVVELPPINGKRRQLRRGGFQIQREAEAALAEEIARLRAGSTPGLTSRRLTVSG